MSKQNDKITTINNLHIYLKDELDKELITKYLHFKIIKNFNSERLGSINQKKCGSIFFD